MLFMKRHPEISIRTAQNLIKSRMVKKSKTKSWFRKIEEYGKEKNLSKVLSDPRKVFNAYERLLFHAHKKAK